MLFRSATVGVGIDNNAVFGVASSPRVSLAYYLRRPTSSSMLGETKLKFNFGKGIREPSPSEQSFSLYQVLTAANGRAALAMAESFLPSSVLLDIGMPGMDGYEVARRLRQDERFANNPLVLGEPGVRFYAGAPLRSAEGHNLGTLCVIDRRPRQLDAPRIEQLQNMADLAMRELELRRLSSLCSVTGLVNRASFFRFGEEEVKQARRDGHPQIGRAHV